jgi:hypothetical protein
VVARTPAVQPRAVTPTGSYVALVARGRRTSYGIESQRQSLELIAPTGVRTVLYSVPVSRRGAGYLTLSDVSADGTTALLTQSAGRRLGRTRALGVDTATGAVRAVEVGRDHGVVQLAPDGTGVVVEDHSGRFSRVGTLSWAGVLRQSGVAVGGRMLSLDASSVLFQTAGKRGVESLDAMSLVTGAVTRRYPTPGLQCSPVRRWDATQVLLSCYGGRTTQVLRLLDPTSGVLTALTDPRPGQDPSGGEQDARALGGALYLQVTSRCGAIAVSRLLSDGTVGPVRLPGRRDQLTLLGTTGTSLVLQTGAPCRGEAPRQSVTLLDLATGTARPLVVLPGKESFERVVALGETVVSQS